MKANSASTMATRSPDSETIVLGVVVLVVVIVALRFSEVMLSKEILLLVGSVAAPAGIGIGLAWYLKRRHQARQTARWARVTETVERTEKIEDLGHTVGGLSAATEAEAGQLSAVDDGCLSLPQDADQSPKNTRPIR